MSNDFLTNRREVLAQQAQHWSSWNEEQGRHKAGERAGINGRDERAGFLPVEYRSLAFLLRIFRASDGMGRVGVQNVADYEPVKQHSQCREMLFHRGF